MARKGKITELYDIGAIEQQQAKVISLIDSFVVKVNEGQAAIIKLQQGGKPSEVINGIENVKAAQQEQTKIVNQAIDASVKLDKAKQQEARTSEQVAKTLIAEEKLRQQTINTQLAEIKLRQANEKAAEKEAAAIAARQEAANAPSVTAPVVAPMTTPIVTGPTPFETNAEKIRQQEEAEIELAKALQEQEEARLAVARATQEQEVDLRRYTETAKESAAVQQESLTAVASQADILEQYTGSLKENLALQASYKEKIAATEAEIKLLNKTTSAADKTGAAYKTQLASLNTRLTEYKASSTGLNQVIATQLKLDRAIPGSLEAMKLEYTLLTRSIDGLTAAELKSVEGIKLQQRAFALQTDIKAADAAINTFGRNVGNYTKSIANAAGTAFGALRKIAYLIPGLGLAGLIGILIDPIVNFTKKLLASSKAIDEVKASQQSLNKAFESNSYTEAIKNVDQLRINIDLAKQGFLSKKDVVEEYNKTIGKTTGSVKTLDEAEQQLTKNGEAYVQMMLLKAAANLALDEAAKKALEAEQARLKDQKEFLEFGDKLVGLSERSAGAAPGGFVPTQNTLKREKEILDAQAKQRKANAIKRSEDEKKIFEDIALKFQKDAAEIAKKFKFNFFDFGGGDGDKKQKQQDFAKELEKINSEISKTEFQTIKERREQEIKSLEEIISDTNKGYYERYQATQEFYNRSKELIDLNLEYELKANRQAIADEKEETKKKLAERDDKGVLAVQGKARKQLNEKLESLDKELITNETEKRTKYNITITELDKKSESQRSSLFKQESEKRKKIAEEEQKFIEEHRKTSHEIDLEKIQNEYDAQQALLEDNFSKGLISEKKYNQKKLELQADLQIKQLENEINYSTALLEEQEKRAKIDEDELQHKIDIAKTEAALITDPAKQKDALIKIGDAENQLTQLKISNNDKIQKSSLALGALQNKLAAAIASVHKSKSDETLKNWTDTFQKIAEAAQAAANLIAEFGKIRSEKEKNAIQQEIDLLEKKKQKDIEVANQSIANAQERAAEIATIEARAAAQREQLEIKQRRAQERQAKFEKAANIAGIILSTALAVVRALSAFPGPPFTIPAAIAAGALGAAQLAIAIATPIPKYAEGVGLKMSPKTSQKQDLQQGHPGGPAIIGERLDKIPEMVEEPNGKTYIVDKPTLFKNLPKGSRVVPLTIENKKIINEENVKRESFITEVKKEISAYKEGIGAVAPLTEKYKFNFLKTENNQGGAIIREMNFDNRNQSDKKDFNNTISINNEGSSNIVSKNEDDLSKIIKINRNDLYNNPAISFTKFPIFSKENLKHDVDRITKTAISEKMNNTIREINITNNKSFAETKKIDKADKIINGLSAIETAIKKIPQPEINVENLISKRIRNNGGTTKWINRKVS